MLSHSRRARAEKDVKVALALVAEGEVALAGAVTTRAIRWMSRDGRLGLDSPTAQSFTRVFDVLAAGCAAVAATERRNPWDSTGPTR